MGIHIGFSRDSYISPAITGNPDPSKYEILRHKQDGDILVIEIHYPDCTNYEGKKILVYEGITLSELKLQKMIDPHFSESKEFVSPIARFEPTDRGWDMANLFAMWMA